MSVAPQNAARGTQMGLIADEVARLALPLLLLDLIHSIAAAATLRVVQSIPYILFGAPAGALTERHITALDALVTAWHGQGPVRLPGGVHAARRCGTLVLGRPPTIESL